MGSSSWRSSNWSCRWRLRGTYPNPIVSGISGLQISNVPTINGELLSYNPSGILQWQQPGFAQPSVYQTYIALGDSITEGVGAVPNQLWAYAWLIAADTGTVQTNYGKGGAMVADVANIYVFPLINPQRTYNPLVTCMIGTNESTGKGAGAYEAVYINIYEAVGTWLTIPQDFKVFAAPSGVTTGTWAADNTYISGMALESTTNNSTVTIPIATSGGPIYAWYRVIDGNGGTFTYALNGGATTAVNAFTTPAINTADGTTQAVGLIRIPNVAPGSNSVKFTVTSTTGAGNIVSILGLGTVPYYTEPFYLPPRLFMAGCPPEAGNTNNAASVAYNNDAMIVANTLAGDGLPVYFVNVRAYLNPFIDFYQSGAPAPQHPTNTGHSHLRDAFEATIQFYNGFANGIFYAPFNIEAPPPINVNNYCNVNGSGYIPTGGVTGLAAGIQLYTGGNYGLDFGSNLGNYGPRLYSPNGIALSQSPNSVVASGEQSFTLRMLMITETAQTIWWPTAPTSANAYFNLNGSQLASTSVINPGITLYAGNQNAVGMDFGYNTIDGNYANRIFTGPTWDIVFAKISSAGAPVLQTDFTDLMVIQANTGNVGIDNGNPSHTLDIGSTGGTSTLALNGIQASTTPGSGVIPIANAAGNLNSWVTGTGGNYVPYSGAITGVNLNAQTLVNVSGIGIGISTVSGMALAVAVSGTVSSGIVIYGASSAYPVTIPSTISNLTVWIEPNSDGLANGASVSTYTEKSNNAIVFTQATGSLQPVKNTTYLGGLGTWYFNGAASKYLTSATFPIANVFNGGAITAFIVIANDGSNTSTNDGIFTAGTYGNAANVNFYLPHGASAIFDYDEPTSRVSASYAITSSLDIWVLQKNSSTLVQQILLNNNTLLSATGGAAFSTTGNETMTIGAIAGTGDQFGGYLAELIVFDTELSTSQYIGVYNYIAQKFGLTMLPGTSNANYLTALDNTNTPVAGINGLGNIYANNISRVPSASNIPEADYSGTLDMWVTGNNKPFYHILCGIDSLTDGPSGTGTYSYPYYLRQILWNIYGYGGPGLQMFDPEVAGTEIVVQTATGPYSWSYSTGATLASFQNAPGTYSINAEGIYWPSGTGTLTWDPCIDSGLAPYQYAKIFYLQQPNGGSFTVGFYGQSNTTTVSTNGILSIQTVSIPYNGVTELNFTVNATSGEVAIYGTLFYNNTGICISRACHGSDQMYYHAQLNATTLQSWYNILGLNLYILCAGANDGANSVAPAAFQNYIDTRLYNIAQGRSTTDTLLILPDQTASYQVTLLPGYAEVEIYEAIKRNVGYMPISNAIGSYIQASGSGLMYDALHLSQQGNAYLAQNIITMIGGWAIGGWNTGSLFTTPWNTQQNTPFQQKQSLPDRYLPFLITSGTQQKMYELAVISGNPSIINYDMNIKYTDPGNSYMYDSNLKFSTIANGLPSGHVSIVTNPIVNTTYLNGTNPPTFQTLINPSGRAMVYATPTTGSGYFNCTGFGYTGYSPSGLSFVQSGTYLGQGGPMLWAV